MGLDGLSWFAFLGAFGEVVDAVAVGGECVVVVGGLGCGGRDIGQVPGEGSEQGASGGGTRGTGWPVTGTGWPVTRRRRRRRASQRLLLLAGPEGRRAGSRRRDGGGGRSDRYGGRVGRDGWSTRHGGAGGAGTGPMACSSFTIGTVMTLAPPAPGQQYLRCASLGPEQGWDVTPSPSGDRLAARTAAGTVRLISTVSWTEVAQLASPVGELDAVAFSPDGTTLATVSSEMGEVTLWRASDGAFSPAMMARPGRRSATTAPRWRSHRTASGWPRRWGS